MNTFVPWVLLLLASLPCQGIERVPISRIQGATHQSPYEGKEIETNGVVTRVYKDGFIIQSQSPDNSPETSEAIYIFQEDTTVKVGNDLVVTGKVEEWTPGNESSYNLSLTQIRAEKIHRTSPKSSLPKPVVLNYLLAKFPKVIKHPGSPFDPTANSLDFWEAIEHMRVVVMNATVVGPKSNYGEIAVRVPQATAEPMTARGGYILTGYDFNPARILVALDPENPHKYSTGDKINESIHGNLTYSFGNYKVGSSTVLSAPVENSIPETNLPAPESNFKFATFNIENLYPDLADEKFENLAEIITRSLHSPDIIALQEIHDNSGPTNDKVVDADRTIKKLIRFIKAAGGPHYQFIQLNPENNADGGWPGANIRNGYLYQDTVSLGRKYLLQDPAFDRNKANNYSGTRKPLVAFFRKGDRKVIFINCHLTSKGSDSPSYGALLPAVRFSEVQRIAQTRAIRAHVDDLLAEYDYAGLVVLGDLNDFEFSPAIEVLTQNQGLVNLIDTIPLTERYTYIYQGYSQVLDHILVSPNLKEQLEPRILHLNADLSEGLRASDHDPILAWFKTP